MLGRKTLVLAAPTTKLALSSGTGLNDRTGLSDSFANPFTYTTFLHPQRDE